MGVVYGRNIIWIPFKQLLQVLQSAGILKEEVEQKDKLEKEILGES